MGFKHRQSSVHFHRRRHPRRRSRQLLLQPVLPQNSSSSFWPASARGTSPPLRLGWGRSTFGLHGVCLDDTSSGPLDRKRRLHSSIRVCNCGRLPQHDCKPPFTTNRLLQTVPTQSSSSTTLLFLQSYLLDAYPLRAASAISCTAFTRSLAGAAFPLFMRQQLVGMGTQWTLFLYAMAAVVALPVPFVLLKYGERIRARSTLSTTASSPV